MIVQKFYGSRLGCNTFRCDADPRLTEKKRSTDGWRCRRVAYIGSGAKLYEGREVPLRLFVQL